MKGPLAMRRVALMFGALCGVLAIWYLAVRPTVLTIAVGPAGTSQVAFVETVAKLLRETRQPFRFKILTTDGTEESSRLLDGRKVELALLRSDDLTSKEARSIVIAHRRSLLLVSRKEAEIESLRDIAGKKVAIATTDTDSFMPLIERVMAHFEVDTDDLTIEEIPREDIPAALAEGRVDAIILVTNPAAKAIRSMLADITGARQIEIILSGAPAHEALAVRFQELHTSKVPEGVFGGTPSRPEKDIDTVAISYEIVAGSRMSEQTATELTKALMEMRTRLRSAKDNTFGIETPPVDEQRRFLPHAGTAAFVNSEAKTWFELYSDHIWLGLFSIGLIGSSVAGVMSWAGLKQEAPAETLASQMRTLAGRLEMAGSVGEIDEIQGDFDDLVLAMMREYGLRNLAEEGMPDPSAWITTFAGLIGRRRALMADLGATQQPASVRTA